MSNEYLITSEILTNGRIVTVSLLARYLYMAMILLADHEGRATAVPNTWKAQASLWGAAETSIDEIARAILELETAGLIVLYDDGSRLFLPGRFEHNRSRKWWKRSKHPLPPIELLRKHIEYLNGLGWLTTKGRLYEKTIEDRRYPELSEECTPALGYTVSKEDHNGNRGELGGSQGERNGNSGEVGIDVGVGVDVDRDIKPASGTPSSDHDQVDDPPYGTIIAHLNEKAGTKYQPSRKSTRNHIRARWNEGYRLDDFRKVIDFKTDDWRGTDFAKYLRPDTLFGPKFEGYLNSGQCDASPPGEAYKPFKEEDRDYEQR